MAKEDKVLDEKYFHFHWNSKFNKGRIVADLPRFILVPGALNLNIYKSINHGLSQHVL